MIFYRNLREITFQLMNVIPERIIFVSWGITVLWAEWQILELNWQYMHMQGKLAIGVKVKKSKTRPWCVQLPSASAGLTPHILMSIYCVSWAYTKYTHIHLYCLLGSHHIQWNPTYGICGQTQQIKLIKQESWTHDFESDIPCTRKVFHITIPNDLFLPSSQVWSLKFLVIWMQEDFFNRHHHYYFH